MHFIGVNTIIKRQLKLISNVQQRISDKIFCTHTKVEENCHKTLSMYTVTFINYHRAVFSKHDEKY